MRILQVITRRQLRGAEIFAYQLSAEMVKRGHSVMMVALWEPKEFPELGAIEHVDFNLQKSERFMSFRAWKQFADLVKTWKPDVIQANASETLKFTVLSKKLYRWHVPVVYRNANKISDFFNGSFRSKVSKLTNSVLVSNTDFTISVSENCRQDFVATLHVPPQKTATVPIGTILPSSAQPLSPDALPYTYWVNVGSLVPEKNHAGLLRIYKSYKQSGGKHDLVIVGDGRGMENLRNQASALGISDKVHFLGYRKNAVDIMQRAVGLALPSNIEGLPGVILEAMAHRVPIAAYGVGGIPEVIDHSKTGMLIDKGDEKAFVDAMLKLEGDSTLRDTVVAKAYELCEKQFSIESITDQFLDHYGKLSRQ